MKTFTNLPPQHPRSRRTDVSALPSPPAKEVRGPAPSRATVPEDAPVSADKKQSLELVEIVMQKTAVVCVR